MGIRGLILNTLRMLFGVGKVDSDFKPSPWKIFFSAVVLGYLFLFTVTSLIVLVVMYT